MEQTVIAQVEFDRIVRDSKKLPKVITRTTTIDSLKCEVVSDVMISKDDFIGLDLTGTEFNNCTFVGVYFRKNILNFSKFHNCNFNGCDFTNSEIKRITFGSCNFDKCNFFNSDLTYANFLGCKLSNTTFRRANLRSASFEGSKIVDCNFNAANTVGVDGFYSVDNVGTFFGKITLHAPTKTIWAGCWSGNLEEFENKINGICSDRKGDIVLLGLEEELDIVLKFFKLKTKHSEVQHD